MKLVDLKTQALRYLALGEHEQALLAYRAILRHLPEDLDARMRVADVLVHLKQPELARRVYAAVAWCDLQAGRPLHALVCAQALSDLGHGIGTIHESLAQLYGAGSQRLSRGKPGRLAPVDPETEVADVDLTALPANLAAESAAESAADTETFTAFPQALAPVPLLSDLPEAAFAQLTQVGLIRRLAARAPIIKQGTPAYSLFLVASGAVEISMEGPAQAGGDGAVRTVLGRLGEGSVVGELALLGTHPRLGSVETCEPADLIELPIRALRGLGPEVAAAADRLMQDRLLRMVVGRSPLFQPLTVGQRLELVRRFTPQAFAEEDKLVHETEVPAGLYVIASGTVEVLRGSEPFETVVGRLQPGDLFGELHLVRPGPAGFTLRAAEPVVALVLQRDPFDRMVTGLPTARSFFEHLPPELAREMGAWGRSLLRFDALTEPEDDERRAEFPFFV